MGKPELHLTGIAGPVGAFAALSILEAIREEDGAKRCRKIVGRMRRTAERPPADPNMVFVSPIGPVRIEPLRLSWEGALADHCSRCTERCPLSKVRRVSEVE
jgi:hypothetical protein